MKHFLFLFLLISGSALAQQRGQVFPRTAKAPTERTNEMGTIVVTKSLYGLKFEDNSIPEVYKEAVKTFFKETLKPPYKTMKTYRLKVAKKQGYIWIEGKKIITDP